MKAPLLCGFACAAVLCSTIAGAASVVVNGSFDTDLSGWTPTVATGGIVSFDGAAGAPAAGSVRLVSPDLNATSSVFQCVPYTPAGPVDLLGSSLPLVVAGSSFTALDMTLYDDATCSGSVLGVFNAAVIGTETGTGGASWTRWGIQNFMLDANTRSVGLGINAAAVQVGDSIDILWDHIQFGPSGTLPVELQSFVVE